ncbi:MAG: ATP-binding protein [Pseudomonadota bacterium]
MVRRDIALPYVRPLRVISVDTMGSELAVRAALEDMRGALTKAALDEDTLGSVTLVLAEALNNIAEHAYAGMQPGQVQVRAEIFADYIVIQLRDHGCALPGLQLPAGHLPDASGPRESLPEGGFGWFLIHELTETLNYKRANGENSLELRFARKPCSGS